MPSAKTGITHAPSGTRDTTADSVVANRQQMQRVKIVRLLSRLVTMHSFWPFHFTLHVIRVQAAETPPTPQAQDMPVSAFAAEAALLV